jgi:phage FluMu protein Com
MIAKEGNNWIRCGKCGHKLGRIIGAGYCDPAPILEIKCHSCKEINQWWYKEWLYKDGHKLKVK